MDYTLLRAFVTVAREGNLTRAAAQLHLTQPAVSLQIKNLQETLGVDAVLADLARAARSRATAKRCCRTPNARSPRRPTCSAPLLRCVTKCADACASARFSIPDFLRLGGFLRQLVETLSAHRNGLAARHVGLGAGAREGARSGCRLSTSAIRPTTTRATATAFTSSRSRRSCIACSRRRAGTDRVNKGKRDWAVARRSCRGSGRRPSRRTTGCCRASFEEAGVKPVIVAEVDQEPSMLDLVKSGVGLTLARDSIAIAAGACARADDRRRHDRADPAVVRRARRAPRRTGDCRGAAPDRGRNGRFEYTSQREFKSARKCIRASFID